MNDVTHYNNYYEFGTDKDDPAKNAQEFRDLALDRFRRRRSGQAAQVHHGRNYEARAARGAHLSPSLRGGMVDRRALDRLFAQHAHSSWSSRRPRRSLSRFRAYYDSKQMPLGPEAGIQLPYVEGLRLDEAMHPLALLCVGMYGETLPNQDGAPVRMVIPWKYGFKSIKSIVKISFVEEAAAHHLEYLRPARIRLLFQCESRTSIIRAGARPASTAWAEVCFARPIPTLMFNGYGDQVASLYAGMDLRKYY